jgi:hypothetical protein
MTRYGLNGGCYCGNIVVVMELARPPGAYEPRACDCDFCRKHGAAYVSDARGSLSINVLDKHRLQRYRQGGGIADCLLCMTCGVLVGIVYQDGDRLYATVNSRIISGEEDFGPEQSVSPRLLSDADKVERWKRVWFGDVILDIHAG